MKSSLLKEDDADDEWMDADDEEEKEEEEDDWLGGGGQTFGSAPPRQVRLQHLLAEFSVSPTSSCPGAGGH